LNYNSLYQYLGGNSSILEELTMTEHDNWLNLTVEEVIDPELPVCDAHHHLRSLQANRYLTADFLKDAGGGHNITHSVVIQSRENWRQGPGGGMTPLEETQWVMKDISTAESRINVAAGFVGYADLTLGDAVAPIIESNIAVGKGRFRGIRFSRRPGTIEGPDAKSVLSEPDFQEGLGILHKYDLTYELVVRPHQFEELADLARRFSDTPIIVNHIGWVFNEGQSEKQHEEQISEWKRSILAMVHCNNIYIKLGGLGASQAGFGWDNMATPPGSAELAGVMAPYYLYCIDHFGVKRCMFESNFPVDKESYSYTILWNAFKHITKGFTYAERCALFHDTAVQVYSL
jgi:L-fuconolactonase